MDCCVLRNQLPVTECPLHAGLRDRILYMLSGMVATVLKVGFLISHFIDKEIQGQRDQETIQSS